VELYFDPQTEEKVWEIRRSLIRQGITSTISDLGDRPHVSLAGFPTVNADELLHVTKEFTSRTNTLAFQLSAVGAFPTDENVLYLAPVLSRQLMDIHQEFHDQLVKANLASSPYYLPGNWVPHCTVEMNIPTEQFSKAFDLCKKMFRPTAGTFLEIGVIEFRPIKHLASWALR